jgi:hypothetical protein
VTLFAFQNESGGNSLAPTNATVCHELKWCSASPHNYIGGIVSMFSFILRTLCSCDIVCVHLMPLMEAFLSSNTVGPRAPSTNLLDRFPLLELVELLQFLTRPW